MNDAVAVIWSRRRLASALSEKVVDLLLFLGLLLRLFCCCCGPLAAAAAHRHICAMSVLFQIRVSVQRYSAAYNHLKHDCEQEHDCIIVRRIDGVAGTYAFLYRFLYLYIHARSC